MLGLSKTSKQNPSLRSMFDLRVEMCEFALENPHFLLSFSDGSAESDVELKVYTDETNKSRMKVYTDEYDGEGQVCRRSTHMVNGG
jgi:hypothetical protein